MRKTAQNAAAAAGAAGVAQSAAPAQTAESPAAAKAAKGTKTAKVTQLPETPAAAKAAKGTKAAKVTQLPETPAAAKAIETAQTPAAPGTSKPSRPAKGKTPRAPASPFCRPGRPRRQKTAQQLLGRLLGAPLPPHTARLGCLESWAEGEDPAGGGQNAAGPLRGCLQMYEGMLLAQMARALEGDLKALQFIRETMGERAEEKPAPETLSSGDRALLSKLAARLGLEGETL